MQVVLYCWCICSSSLPVRSRHCPLCSFLLFNLQMHFKNINYKYGCWLVFCRRHRSTLIAGGGGAAGQGALNPWLVNETEETQGLSFGEIKDQQQRIIEGHFTTQVRICTTNFQSLPYAYVDRKSRGRRPTSWCRPGTVRHVRKHSHVTTVAFDFSSLQNGPDATPTPMCSFTWHHVTLHFSITALVIISRGIRDFSFYNSEAKPHAVTSLWEFWRSWIIASKWSGLTKKFQSQSVSNFGKRLRPNLFCSFLLFSFPFKLYIFPPCCTLARCG